MAYSDIDKPSDYFNTVLYTGDGTDQTISGVGFKPDWLWIKSRSSNENHVVYDSVRGNLTSGQITKSLFPNLTNAEGGNTTNQVDTFTNDGFEIIGNSTLINSNTVNYVAWNWLSGGTASSNTDGSITSNVSANTTSGFSIVSFTGTGSAGTIGHGLGATPVMGIFKNRTDAATNWRVWHQGITNTQILELNATSAAGVPGTADFNISNNTIDVWGLETNNQSNGSGDSMIAYIFAEKKGFSKAFSYTANGSADGNFVYLGFKPAFLIIKQTNTTRNWNVIDNKRADVSGANVIDKTLNPNANYSETSSYDTDFLSNGFKIRTTIAGINNSGGSYVGFAFAESPFVTSTGVPTTAR